MDIFAGSLPKYCPSGKNYTNWFILHLEKGNWELVSGTNKNNIEDSTE